MKYKKAWIQYHNEANACKILNEIVDRTNFDNYILVADDVIATQKSLDIVHSLLETNDLATGYCKLAQDNQYVNVCRAPLTQKAIDYSSIYDYEFYHLEEVKLFPRNEFVSWFGGWCLTGVRREILLSNPLRLINEHCPPDYNFSYWLGQQELSFRSHKETYIEHIKKESGITLQTGNMVGKLVPRVIIND